MNFTVKDEEQLLKLQDKGIFLEGNLLKIIKSTSTNFTNYLNVCKTRDLDARKKRLKITKEIQKQNKDLLIQKKEIESLNDDMQKSLLESEKIKEEALNSLDVIQKRTQFELVTIIVKIALSIIIGVGVLTTLIYLIAIFTGKDTQLIGNTWNSLFGILLTNSFSIIGTIMGVKYASENKNK